LNLRVPSCARAADVCDSANSRSDPGQRRSTSAAQARCSDPVASTAITGDAALSSSPANRSMPTRDDGNDTGRTNTPSAVVTHTRLITLPGATATITRPSSTSLI